VVAYLDQSMTKRGGLSGSIHPGDKTWRLIWIESFDPGVFFSQKMFRGGHFVKLARIRGEDCWRLRGWCGAQMAMDCGSALSFGFGL
jgi:hypothetical protein